MKRENKYLKIKACAKVNAGYPLRGAASKLDKGELGLIRLQNVSGGTHIRFDEVERVCLPKSKKVEFLSEGDIVFDAEGRKTLRIISLS